MKMKVIKFVLMLIVLFLPNIADAETDKQLYQQALKAIEKDKRDFAFLYFYSLLDKYPRSKFAEQALFAVGEYYFSVNDAYNAAESFSRFVHNYPESGARPFALVYLLDMAIKRCDLKQMKELEKQILNAQQPVLLSKDFEEYSFTSPLRKQYKAVYFIDRIEFYINGELFAKIFCGIGKYIADTTENR